MKLFVATTNPKKLEELRALLKGLPFELVSLSEFPQIKEVPETGATFRENAEIKALGYARQTGLLTLGEDSGLCCDALEGAPGVYSARFSGEEKNDAKNNEKLLKLLEKLPDNCRGAHYACAIAIAEPGKVVGYAEGEVHGAIAKKPVGTGGFGYDPLFFYLPFQKTFAQVPAEMKHGVSHRANALKKVRQILENHSKTNA